MTYDPRTIAFAAEILYPPQQLRADLVQTVHNTLYQKPELGYQNFQVAPDGIHLSNLPQAPGQVSMASFRFDRLVLREEMRPCLRRRGIGAAIVVFVVTVLVVQLAFLAPTVGIGIVAVAGKPSDGGAAALIK